MINIRIGKSLYSNAFESTINGINEPLTKTMDFYNKMREVGEGNIFSIRGEMYIVRKVLIEADRIIAECSTCEEYYEEEAKHLANYLLNESEESQ